MLENLTIVRIGMLQKLQTRAKLWGMGWLVSGLTLLGCSGLTYEVLSLKNSVESLTYLQAETARVQESQAKALINSWSEHKVAVERLTEFADFVKERQALVQYNQDTKMDRRSALGMK